MKAALVMIKCTGKEDTSRLMEAFMREGGLTANVKVSFFVALQMAQAAGQNFTMAS